MTIRIALLGWGSLLWEHHGTFDGWHEPWQRTGPSLPIEFSRVSRSRKGALTLVIDPEHGVLVRVAWCLSRRPSIDEAISDLREREQTTVQNIGWLSVNGTTSQNDPDIQNSIHAWARERYLNGVVWTNLQSNFAEKTGKPFSVGAAMLYLKSLDGASKIKAIEYFKRAPSFIQTPLRIAFNSEIEISSQLKP